MGYHGRFEQKKIKKARKWKKAFLIVLLALLVLVLAAVGAGIWYYQNMLSKVKYVEMPTETTAYAETTETTAAATETVETTAPEVTTAETTRPPMTSDDILNILVVGQAARAGEESRMADTMILVSLNTYTKTVHLTSFLRDTYVDLPDYKGHTCGWNKLTTCYALGYSFGGKENGTAYAMDMTNICLRNNFGIEVDYNVEIDFESFIRVVDLMGGVELELTPAEAEYLNSDNYPGQVFSEGWASIDGTDALSYARMRKAEGDNDSDIKRTSRQRYVLEMLLRKLKMLSLSDVQKIANEVLPMITTNMSSDNITKALLKVLPILMELKVESGTCPVATTYKSELKETPDGTMYALTFNAEQQKRLMRAITEGETIE